MRKQGCVMRWDAVRAFGFIRAEGEGADVFFHIRDFRGGAGAAPREGMKVSFEEIHVGGKGPRAMAVQPLGTAAHRAGVDRVSTSARPRAREKFRHAEAPASSGAWFALALMLLYAGVLLWAVWTRQLPWWVLPASAAVNLVAFMAYWFDKYAARVGQWRTSEATLHLWSLAGGWAGAWSAQQVLRHKSRKAEFRSVYWLTVLLHCAAAGAFAWTRGLLRI